ncbi:MAG: hypothetical protein IKG18_14180 [Atopobiaceae bacterium]|nr:hypothetical protein [Atopobiaceae bacterium]
MKNLLRYGPFCFKAPWAHEFPSGEFQERTPRIVLGIIALVVCLHMNPIIERGVYDELFYTSWCYAYKLVIPVMVVAEGFALASLFFVPVSWRSYMRDALSRFASWLVRDDAKEDPWSGVRCDNTGSSELPGISGGYPNMTLYVTAIPESPETPYSPAELCVMDDEGEEITFREDWEPCSNLDMPKLREMFGTGVCLHESQSIEEMRAADEACESAFYHATEIVSYIPITTLFSIETLAYAFDVHAISVLDECADLGISAASDRALTHWMRLQRCAQTLGCEHAPTKMVSYSSHLATLLVKEAHQEAKVRHEAQD